MKSVFFLIFFLFLTIARLQGEDFLSPPGQLPIQIDTNFKLLKLISLQEKEQTFQADVLFTFVWKDPRLAYPSDTNESTRYYLEDAVDAEFDKIWHLQVDFLNAISTNFRNKALVIFPNGQVEYFVRVIGEFEYEADLRKFPFDMQNLKIQVASFLKDKNMMEFIISGGKEIAFSQDVDFYQEENIIDLTEKVGVLPGISLQDINGKADHSVYTVTMVVKRNYIFYMYAVIIPLFLLLIIIYPIFFATKEPFLDKLQLSVTSFLVLVATKFVINQDLPHVGYMMMIDKLFFIAYVYIAIIVISVTLYKIHDKTDEAKSLKIEHHSRWIVPLILIALLIGVVLFT